MESPKVQRSFIILTFLLLFSLTLPSPLLASPIKNLPDLLKKSRKHKTITSIQKSSSSVGNISSPVIADFLDISKKGIGFVLKAGHNFLDFRFKDYLGNTPMSIGDKYIFTPNRKVSIIYTIGGNKVKEDIILAAKPVNNSFSFSISKNYLQFKKKNDGYHFYDLINEEIFFLPNPTVIDAKGKKGKAILEITGNTAVLSVGQNFLDNAVYPVTIDPTIIATSSSFYATGINSQRKNFFDSQRYWSFYSDGTNILYKSSIDSVNWSSPSTIAPSSQGFTFSLWYDKENVYVALMNGYNIDVIKGTVNGSAISWGSQVTALPGTSETDYYLFPTVAKDSQGKIWVSATYYNGTNYYVKARQSLNVDDIGSWEATIYDLSSSANTNSFVFPNLLPLSNGRVYALWLEGTQIEGRLFNGTNWESINSIGTSFITDWVGATPSAVADSSDTIYVAYIKSSSPYNLVYKTGVSSYAAANWSAETTLAAEGFSFPSLSLDTSSSQVYSFYQQWTGDSTSRLKYKKIGSPYSFNLSNSSERAFDRFITYSAFADNWTDVTIEASNIDTGDVKNSAGGKLLANPGDYFYVGMDEPFDSVFFDMGTMAQNLTLAALYWNGSNWTPLNITDNTANLTINEKDVTFTPPQDWAKSSGNYYVIFATSTTPTVAPIGDQITAYKNNLFTSSNYSSGYSPFTTFLDGGNATNNIKFSSPRNLNKLGSKSFYTTYSKDINSTNVSVNLENGNLVLQKEDLSVPARGFSTTINHIYNSKSGINGDFGYGWTISTNRFLKVDLSDWSIIYQDGDGARHRFQRNLDGTFQHPPGVYLDLIVNMDGTYTLINKDKTSYNFDIDGKLVSILDKNNNKATYSYDSTEKLTSINDSSNSNTTLVYGSNGRLKTITDPSGRSMSLGYDASGDLTIITDTMNNTATLTYSNHKLISYTDVGGKTTNFSYTNDKLTNITDPSPLSYSTTFNYQPTYTTVADPKGNTTAYNFDSDGLMISKIDTLGDKSSYQYDNDFNVTGVTDTNNNTSQRTFDANGNLTSETDAASQTVAYNYVDNLLSSKTDAKLNITSYNYDSNGNLTGIVAPLETTTSYQYDTYGDNISETDALGNITNYAYDNLGNLTSVIDPLSNIINYTYDTNGNKASESQPTYKYLSEFETDEVWRNERPSWSSLAFDTSNFRQGLRGLKLVGITTASPLEASRKVNYDLATGYSADDAITVWMYLPEISTVYFELSLYSNSDSNRYYKNLLGNYNGWHKFEFKKSDFTSEGSPAWSSITKIKLRVNNYTGTWVTFDDLKINTVKKTTYTYNPTNLLTSITDNLGNTTKYEYDAAGNKIKEIEALGDATSYVYDANDRLTETINPLGAGNILSYDSRGNKTKTIQPVKLEMIGSFAAPEIWNRGTLDSVNYIEGRQGLKVSGFDLTNGVEQNVAFDLSAYNDTDTISLWIHRDNSNSEINWLEIEFMKDSNNYFYSKFYFEPLGNITWRYDNWAKVSIEKRYLISQGSPSWNNITKVKIVADNSVGANGYFTLDNWQIAKNKETGFLYDDNNRLTKVTDPSKNITTYEYDGVGNKIKEIDANNHATNYDYTKNYRLKTNINSLNGIRSYEYDTNGNKVKEINAKNKSTQFHYNELNRLDKVTDALSNESTMTYDKVGNKTAVTNARGYTTNYEYDANNRLTRTTDALANVSTYGYDITGNKVTEINARGYQTRYLFDPFGRDFEVIKPDGSRQLTKYDALGRKTSAASSLDLMLSDFEADESWSGGASDMLWVKDGIRGRRLTSNNANTASMTRNIDLDLKTNYLEPSGKIRFWVWVANASGLFGTNDIIFDSTGANSTNYFSYTWLNQNSIVDGWNEIIIDKNEFNAVGSPDWSKIKRIMFRITGDPGSTQYAVFDALKFAGAMQIDKQYNY